MKKLVVFSAAWCGPCKTYKPILKEIKAQGYDVTIYDIDEDKDKSDAAGVRGIPTTLVLDESGKEVNRLVGMRAKSQLIPMLEG